MSTTLAEINKQRTLLASDSTGINPTTGGRLGSRSLSPPSSSRGRRPPLGTIPSTSGSSSATKVSLLQGRLLSKAHSDLTSPTVVQRALLMGNALRPPSNSSSSKVSSSSKSLNKSATGGSSSSSSGVTKGQNKGSSFKKASSPGPASQSSTTQVRVQLSRSSPVSKIREILTATTSMTNTSSNNNSSSKKSSSSSPPTSSSSPKGAKGSNKSPPNSSTTTTTNGQPLKPPRNSKGSKGEGGGGGKGGDKEAKEKRKGGSGRSKKSGGSGGESRKSPPTGGSPNQVSSAASSLLPKPPPPTPTNNMMGTSAAPLTTKPTTEQSPPPPRYTVRQRPLAPPAESSAGGKSRSLCRVHYGSLPTLTPYLGEARRVTDSIFLHGGLAPRPTKTSLMRHIIAREDPSSPTTLGGGQVHFKDSKFRSTASEAALFTMPPPPPSPTHTHTHSHNLQPRQKRRRSVSCLNLRDYASYVLALRHTAPRSPRFTRLHSLYSSLERLVELEASSALLPPHLPKRELFDFDAWWRVRHRNRMETEMESLSRELYTAQRDGEFFFRPKTPPIWTPDSHLRFKKWRVEELKAFLTCPDRSRAALWTLDLYKTGWRGVSVKEQALNLEVAELYSKEKEPRPGSPTRSGAAGLVLLRRAFSMSSTLSVEQREGIKRRIGTLITAAAAAKRGEQEGEEEGGGKKSRMMGGRAAVTTRMGFTLSSDPRTITPPCKVPPQDASGLSESRKKEISHRISEEVKERRASGLNKDHHQGQFPPLRHSTLQILTKMGLRKAESFGSPGNKSKKGGGGGGPIYSLYVNHPVNERIKAFEGQNGDCNSNKGLPTTTTPHFKEIKPLGNTKNTKDPAGMKVGGGVKRMVHIVTPSAPQQQQQKRMDEDTFGGPTSLPHFPFRSQSPLLRSPSPPGVSGRRSLSPTALLLPPPSRDYISHINVISKLAELLLRRNTSLKHLLTREVRERNRLERLRSLNSGEVERLRNYFEDRHGSWQDLPSQSAEDVNLLRVLFCSDSNLASMELAESVTPGALHKIHTFQQHTTTTTPTSNQKSATTTATPTSSSRQEGQRPRPDGSSPTPRLAPTPTPTPIHSSKDLLHLNTRCRKPIYQPSSSPNVCQPTLTAHCYLQESLDGGLDQLGASGGRHDSMSYRMGEWSSLPHPCPPPEDGQRNWPFVAPPPLPPPIVHTSTRQHLSYTNYDPSLHQPRFRYVPPPPHLVHQHQLQPLPKRSMSAMGGVGVYVGGGGVRRSESMAGGGYWSLGRRRGYHDDGVLGPTSPPGIRRAIIRRSLQHPPSHPHPPPPQETAV